MMNFSNTYLNTILIFLVSIIFNIHNAAAQNELIAPDAEIEHLAGGFKFTEGPTANARGDVYFTDSHDDHIHCWSLNGELSSFRKLSGGAVGLFFDHEDNLLVCASRDKKLISIDPQGNTTVLADSFNGMPLNRPNDVCSHPEAGIFFTDPRSSRSTEKVVSRVFHLSSDSKRLTAIIEDLIFPNGIIITPDGKVLYIADWAAKKVYAYSISKEGQISNQQVIANVDCDGMTLDELGNIYLTSEEGVLIYNSHGERIALIKVPEKPNNICFGGADRKNLFIAARISLYSLKMLVRGAY